jgi:hypothetical protein
MKKIILIVISVSLFSGCAIPALLGVKSYQSGDTKIDFITGMDVGFGMNGIDTVNNNRGISQEGGFQRSSESKRQSR